MNTASAQRFRTAARRFDPVSLHRPVMLDAAIGALAVVADGIYVDATFGRGGHSRELLAQLDANGRLFGFDRDPSAGDAAAELVAEDSRFEYVPRCYSEMAAALTEAGVNSRINGVLFDLGVSSPQLDVAERGFSIRRDGPLDMRMDPGQGQTAAEWLAEATDKEIADVLFHYGDERASRRIARAIVDARRSRTLRTTSELADLILAALGGRQGRIHPATRSFQAIRIHINQEMDRLTAGLDAASAVLAAGGRLAVISFHSIEDRLVKRYLRDHSRGDSPSLRLVGKPHFPSPDESAENPRSRSAVLRIAERLS